MPRYFFHLRHRPGPAGLAVDTEGDILADPQAARRHALWLARDMTARIRTHFVRDWMACAFEIADETGRTIVTVPFADSVPEPDGWD